MGEKKNDSIAEKEEWDDLFGVSYFSNPTDDGEEKEEQGTEEESADEEELAEKGETHDESEEEAAGNTEEPQETEEETEEAEATEEQSEEAEEAGTDDQKLTAEVAEILATIRAIDPTIESFNDLEDVGMFALLIDAGNTPEEALRESSPKMQARLVKAQKSASKNHLRATAANARDDDVDMDAINTVRRLYPGLSKKDAIELSRRVNAQK